MCHLGQKGPLHPTSHLPSPAKPHRDLARLAEAGVGDESLVDHKQGRGEAVFSPRVATSPNLLDGSPWCWCGNMAEATSVSLLPEMDQSPGIRRWRGRYCCSPPHIWPHCPLRAAWPAKIALCSGHCAWELSGQDATRISPSGKEESELADTCAVGEVDLWLRS